MARCTATSASSRIGACPVDVCCSGTCCIWVRSIPRRTAVFDHLVQRWRALFNVEFDVLLYDLTSTYFEANPPFDDDDKRKYGYSRDKRPDCVQVVIALVVTPGGLPLAYEVLPGNTADSTTLRDFLARIERQYTARPDACGSWIAVSRRRQRSNRCANASSSACGRACSSSPACRSPHQELLMKRKRLANCIYPGSAGVVMMSSPSTDIPRAHHEFKLIQKRS